MIMGRAGWDIPGATYFEAGRGPVTLASYEPWAYEQIEMLKLERGDSRDMGPYFSAEQITMIYKVCLKRGLGTNAKELHELSYRGDRDVAARRTLRVWMPVTAAKDIKFETESMDSDGVTAQASAPVTGAVANDSEKSCEADSSTAGRPAAAKDEVVKKETPSPPPLIWSVQPVDQDVLIYRKIMQRKIPSVRRKRIGQK